MIDFDSPPGPFCLPQAPESVRPILEVLPVQMASLALAAMKGREAGRFVRLTTVTTVEGTRAGGGARDGGVFAPRLCLRAGQSRRCETSSRLRDVRLVPCC